MESSIGCSNNSKMLDDILILEKMRPFVFEEPNHLILKNTGYNDIHYKFKIIINLILPPFGVRPNRELVLSVCVEFYNPNTPLTSPKLPQNGC